MRLKALPKSQKSIYSCVRKSVLLCLKSSESLTRYIWIRVLLRDTNCLLVGTQIRSRLLNSTKRSRCKNGATVFVSSRMLAQAQLGLHYICGGMLLSITCSISDGVCFYQALRSVIVPCSSRLPCHYQAQHSTNTIAGW